MNCKICQKPTQKAFSTMILNKYNVKFYKCRHCGFLQSEEPYWIKEAYHEAINEADTGIIERNIRLSQITYCLITVFFSKKISLLDWGGGIWHNGKASSQPWNQGILA